MMHRWFLLLVSYLLLSGGAAAQQPDSLKRTLTLTYDRFHFDRQFPSDWHVAGLEYLTQTTAGPLIGRMSYASRLNKSGWQAEAEAYPRLSKKIYSYIGLGFSPDMPVFPKYRGGASLFVNFLKGWEAEGGLRYLYFDQQVWVGIAGVSKYAGAWLLNLRSFFSQAPAGAGQAYFFTARYYFGTQNHYAWLQLGSGVSPDESRNVQLNINSQLNSRRVVGGIRYHAGRHIFQASSGYSRDEYLPRSFGNQWLGSLSYGVRF